MWGMQSVLSYLFVVLAFAFGTTTAEASVPPGMPPTGKLMLGLGGTAIEPPAFDRLTGGTHELYLVTIPWNERRSWHDALDVRLEGAGRDGYRLIVHIGPNRVDNGREGRSPGAVSRGAADAYFLDMSRILNVSGQFAYVRPPAEMNGHWSLWSAYDANGSRRDADHSTRSYRRAFVRLALISRGGSVAKINTALRSNGMPPLRTSATILPSSGRIAMVWNPQGRGKPDIVGNQPKDYYPGRAWVDYVANDMYVQHGSAAWDANEAFYARFARVHPLLMAEYAPWGYDDPAFVRRMFAWAATHPRVVGLVYFNGTGGTTFRLATKRRTLATYRTLAGQARYRCAAFSAFVETCAVPTG